MIQNHTKPATAIIRSLLALSAASSCLYAQTPAPAPEAELAPVTVSAHGLTVPYDNTGVSVSVLDIPQLKKEGVTTLTEALTTVPGTFVLPGGGLNQRGNVSNIALRGMSSGTMTLAMLDGMRLYNSGGGGNLAPNILGHTNLFALGNVEVLRGAEGAVYGNGAMGGVIFMETPEGKGKPSVSTFQEAGSFDTYTGNVTAQGQLGKLSYFLSSTYEHTNNDIRFADGSKPTGGRHDGRYAQWAEALRLDYRFNERNKVTLTYRREDADFHYVSRYRDYYTGGFACSRNLYDWDSNLVTAKWTSRLTEKWTSSILAGYYGYDSMLGHGFYSNLRNVQIEWRNAYRWNEQNTTTAGFAWNRSDYRIKSAYSMTGNYNDDSLENIYSLFAEHTLKPAKGLDLSLAARLDESNLFDTHADFRLAASYKLNREHTRVFSSVGSGYRAPGSFQKSNAIYSNGYSTYKGNPDLDCERSLSFDIGVEQKIADAHKASLTYFITRREDAIATFFDPADNAYHYANATGHWLSQGVEFALRGTWEKNWNTGYTLAYTLTQPKTNNDVQIPQTSRQLWSADIHTSPCEKLTVGLGLAAAVGRNSDQSQRLDNYYTLRCYAHYKVNEHLSLHLRVENLTDQQFITEPSFGYPADAACSQINSGIGIFAGCTLGF